MFFSTHLVYQQGNESHHLLSLVARAARCPEKNGKTQGAREIKALDPSPGLMIGFATILTSFFSLSLSLLPSFSSSFSSFIYIYIQIYRRSMCVLCVTRSFHFLPSGRAAHTLCAAYTLYAHLVERIFNERLNSFFMVYL